MKKKKFHSSERSTSSPGSSRFPIQRPPPYWKTRRRWGRGCKQILTVRLDRTKYVSPVRVTNISFYETVHTKQFQCDKKLKRVKTCKERQGEICLAGKSAKHPMNIPRLLIHTDPILQSINQQLYLSVQSSSLPSGLLIGDTT